MGSGLITSVLTKSLVQLREVLPWNLRTPILPQPRSTTQTPLHSDPGKTARRPVERVIVRESGNPTDADLGLSDPVVYAPRLFLPERKTQFRWLEQRPDRRRGIATGINQAVSSATNFALAVAIARNGTSPRFWRLHLGNRRIRAVHSVRAGAGSRSAHGALQRASAEAAEDGRHGSRQCGCADQPRVLSAHASYLVLTDRRGAHGSRCNRNHLGRRSPPRRTAICSVRATSPTTALINDGLWMCTSIAAYGVLAAEGVATLPNLLLAWGATGTLCFLIGLVHLRIRPSFGAGLKSLETRNRSAHDSPARLR